MKKRVNQNQSNKAAIAHPRYSEMIQDAINCLHSRKGSSRHAILKFIVGKYKLCNESLANKRLKMTLKTEVKRGFIKNATGEGASGSFKLVKAARRPSKKPTKSRNQIKSPKLKATKRKISILSQKASSVARSGNQMKHSTQHKVLKKITEKQSQYKKKESKSDKQRPIVKKTLNNTTKSKNKRPNAAFAERTPKKARKNKGYEQNMAVVGKAQENTGNTLRSKRDKNMKHPTLNNADTRKL